MYTIADIFINALDKDYSLERAATDLGELMNEQELIRRRSGAAMGLPTGGAESAEEHGTVRWQIDGVVMGNAIRGVRVRQFICMARNRPPTGHFGSAC